MSLYKYRHQHLPNTIMMSMAIDGSEGQHVHRHTDSWITQVRYMERLALSVPETLRKQKDRGHLALEKPEKLTNSVNCTILLSKCLGAFCLYISFDRKGKILSCFCRFLMFSFISFHMFDWFQTMCIHLKGFKRWSKDRQNRHWCSVILSRLNYLMLVCITTCS